MKVVILFLLVFVISSCGDGKHSHTSIVVTQSAVINAPVAGGLMLQTSGVSGIRNYDVPASHDISIPFGTYNMYLVGFDGPGAWTGTVNCGMLSGVVLNQATQSLTVNLTPSDCSNEPYVSMIATKVAKWDSAIWDKSKWGP